MFSYAAEVGVVWYQTEKARIRVSNSSRNWTCIEDSSFNSPWDLYASGEHWVQIGSLVQPGRKSTVSEILRKQVFAGFECRTGVRSNSIPSAQSSAYYQELRASTKHRHPKDNISTITSKARVIWRRRRFYHSWQKCYYALESFTMPVKWLRKHWWGISCGIAQNILRLCRVSWGLQWPYHCLMIMTSIN